jgi:dGTPase
VVPDRTRAEIAVLKAIGVFHVMNSPARQRRRADQRALLTELVQALWKTAPAGLDAAYAADFGEAADDGARFRVVVDQVASLTDASADAWHARL